MIEKININIIKDTIGKHILFVIKVKLELIGLF